MPYQHLFDFFIFFKFGIKSDLSRKDALIDQNTIFTVNAGCDVGIFLVRHHDLKSWKPQSSWSCNEPPPQYCSCSAKIILSQGSQWSQIQAPISLKHININLFSRSNRLKRDIIVILSSSCARYRDDVEHKLLDSGFLSYLPARTQVLTWDFEFHILWVLQATPLN